MRLRLTLIACMLACYAGAARAQSYSVPVFGGVTVKNSSGATTATITGAGAITGTSVNLGTGLFTGNGSPLDITTTGAVNLNARTTANIAADRLNVRDFGAFGDGSSHPLSAVCGTLAACQAGAYPAATSTSEEADQAAAAQALAVALGREQDAGGYFGPSFPAIYFPAGTYLLNDFSLPYRMTLIGDGRAATWLQATNSGATAVLHMTAAPSSATSVGINYDHATVRGVTVNANGSGIGISMDDAPYALTTRYGIAGKLEEVTIINATSQGLYGGTNRNWGIIYDLNVQLCVIGVTINGYDWRMVQGDIGQNTNTGLSFAAGGSHDITDYNIYSNGIGVNKSIYVNSYLHFIGGSIDDNSTEGLNLQAYTGGTTADSVTLSGTSVSNNVSSGSYPQIQSAVTALILDGVNFSNSSNTPTYIVNNTAGRVYWNGSRILTTGVSSPFSVAAFANPANVIGVYTTGDTGGMTLGSALSAPTICLSGTSDCLLHTGSALAYQPNGTTVASIGDTGAFTGTAMTINGTAGAITPSLSANGGALTINNGGDLQLQFGEATSAPALYLQGKRVANDGTSWPISLNPAGGDVGIGTTNPGDLLDVETTSQFHGIRVGNTTNPIAKIYGSSATNDTGVLNLLSAGTTNVQLWANGNSYLNGGNVGIGTTAPAAPLQVSNSFNSIGLGLAPYGAVGTSQTLYGTSLLGLNLVGSGNGSYAANSDGSHNGGAALAGDVNGNLYFVIAPSNGTPTSTQTLTAVNLVNDIRMMINSSGYVGIGTTSPGANLEVDSNEAESFHVTDTTSGDFLYAAANRSNGGYVDIGGYGGGGALPLVINRYGGNVGIGTTVPAYTLDVSGSFHVSGSIASGSSPGVSCTGTPSSSFATVNGIVTHC